MYTYVEAYMFILILMRSFMKQYRILYCDWLFYEYLIGHIFIIQFIVRTNFVVKYHTLFTYVRLHRADLPLMYDIVLSRLA